MKTRKPDTENRTLPKRVTNASLRSREYLTPSEAEKLIKAAGGSKYGHRDATMILLAIRHALRPSEACAVRWDQFDLKQGTFHVNRVKNGLSSVHPLTGRELRALKRLQREQPVSRYVFISHFGSPISTEGFRKLVRRAGERANLPFSIHPHMLRHTGGYKLANDGQDTRAIQLYMGHRNSDKIRSGGSNPIRSASCPR